ncbi:molybdate ABC transporter substrate-binding protein [Vibrio salinus]|uniref:molybdate ABC transporter substrate-binding protein n=1 Tax=Vibrio salinus TaxID=2899784 RepID=UPI001E2CA6FD|nr:molybdate ABC transporter substrate-binding protein [Vibrio salinus]MCE0495429.1 molybdate ABC transporter substrate-binding protein [Vibrio salinus]
MRLRIIAGLVTAIIAGGVQAETAMVAVANNFFGPMKALNQDFSKVTPDSLEISTGSTGQLYAQIINGAPFDLFFAADKARPEKLTAAGKGFHEFTYARGTLVLWSEKAGITLTDMLKNSAFSHLAIANPKLAPYGLAAKQSLTKMNLWNQVSDKLVMGKGLNPTYQYIVTDNAELGFIAKSQVYKNGRYKTGSYWEVPIADYDEIRQDAVTLASGKDNKVVKAFLDYLKTDRAQAIIKSYGYQ